MNPEWLEIQRWGRWAAERVTGCGRHVNTVPENNMLQRSKSPRLPTPFHVGMKMSLKTELWLYFSELRHPYVEWPFSTWKRWLITALGLFPTRNVHHPSKNSYFFFLSHQDALCDSQHISKYACESVVNRTWRHSAQKINVQGPKQNDYFSQCLSTCVEELWKSKTDFSPHYYYLNSNSFPLQVIANYWA